MVDASQIKEHMDVVDSNGQPVGTVDRVEGDQIKLTKNDAGQHQYIPLASVESVDQNAVTVNLTAGQKREQATLGGSRL